MKTASAPTQAGKPLEPHNLNVWVTGELGLAFEAYRQSLRPVGGVKATVQMLLEDALAERGFWPPKN